MKPRLLSFAFVFAALLLSTEPIQAAHFCIEPGFGSGLFAAEMIFSGKITKVERVQYGLTPIREYVVTFKVERWWKGTPVSNPRVLWRSSFMDCELAVGEAGDDYLVYANPSIVINPRDRLPEVTFSNRTSRLPPSRKAEIIVKNGFSSKVISWNPPLNRIDASNDIDLLLTMRECGCLQIMPPANSESPAPIEASAEKTQLVSACQACLRRMLKPFP